MLHGIVSETRGSCFPWLEHGKHKGNGVGSKKSSSSAPYSAAGCLSTPLSPPNSVKDDDPAHNPSKKRKMFIHHYARMAHQLYPHETPGQKLSDYSDHHSRRKFKKNNCQFRPGIFSLKVESLVRPRSSDVASSTPTQPATKALAHPPSAAPIVTIQSARDIMDLSSDDGLSLSDLSSSDTLDDVDDDDDNGVNDDGDENDNDDNDEGEDEADEEGGTSRQLMRSCHFLQKRRTKRMREHREQLPSAVEIDHAHLFENIDLEVPDEQFYPVEWLPSTEKMEDASIELDLSWNKGPPIAVDHMPFVDRLHPRERAITEAYRLPPETFLRAKRATIYAAAMFARAGIPFRKKHAKIAVRIDVNKTGKLWNFYELFGWLTPHQLHPTRYVA